MYTHLVFDIDGTLLDTIEADVLGVQETVEQFTGVKHPFETLHAALGRPSRPILLEFGIPENKIEEASRVWIERMMGHHGSIKLYPGVDACLRQLSAAGLSLGLVTSKNPQEYALDFGTYEVSRLFQTLITADDSARHKPHPEPLLKYLERTGAQPEQTIYIGDTPYDRDCAKGAGIDFALALWGSAHPQMEGAKYRLSKPDELLSLLSIDS